MKILLLAALAALSGAAPAAAQVPPATLPGPTLERKSLTLEGARRVIAAAGQFARRNGAGGVIAVVDEGGNLVGLERLDGTFPAGAKVSIGKARTAALFRRPTSFFEKVVNEGRTVVMVALDDFTPLQGGVPIVVDGQVVGAVGVSGAKSAAQDEEMANAGAAALSTPVPAGGSGATSAGNADGVPQIDFLGGDAVAAAFAKGAPLFENEEYEVHASRRDAAGAAEIHLRDTDIIHVLEGSATFVTGGRVVDARESAPDEVRGSRIADGESRTLRAGDVIIVPAGVPHWFQEVKGPLTYYVVKVTRATRACP